MVGRHGGAIEPARKVSAGAAAEAAVGDGGDGGSGRAVAVAVTGAGAAELASVAAAVTGHFTRPAADDYLGCCRRRTAQSRAATSKD